MAREIKTVVKDLHYLECPRWHEERIWFVDFYSYKVYSAREDGSDLRVEAEVPGQPSGLGWLPDGRLLIVSMRDHRILRRETVPQTNDPNRELEFLTRREAHRSRLGRIREPLPSGRRRHPGPESPKNLGGRRNPNENACFWLQFPARSGARGDRGGPVPVGCAGAAGIDHAAGPDAAVDDAAGRLAARVMHINLCCR